MEHDAAVTDGLIGDPLIARRPRPAVNRVEVLYRAHRVRLTRLACAITLDRSLAEEVVQDAFAGLNRHGQHVSNPEGYLQRSVVNLSIKLLRRRSVAARHQLDPAPVTSIPELDETWNVVKELPPRQRAVIVLRYWNDLSEEDIAQTLGWPKGTVKSTLHRALDHLRKGLTP